jgi:hypothetical protein
MTMLAHSAVWNKRVYVQKVKKHLKFHWVLDSTLHFGPSFRVTWIPRADSAPLAFPSSMPKGYSRRYCASVYEQNTATNKSGDGERRAMGGGSERIHSCMAKLAYQKWVAKRERNARERDESRGREVLVRKVSATPTPGSAPRAERSRASCCLPPSLSRVLGAILWHLVHAPLESESNARLPARLPH